MRILVVGASGRSGRQLVALALEHGHEVTALVRVSRRLAFTDHRLTVAVGDVLRPSTLAGALWRQDAVISLLAPRPRTSGRVYVDGTHNLTDAAVSAGVRRIVIVSASGAGVDSRALPLAYRLVRLIPVVARLYPSIALMEGDLKARDDIDWTVVRPPLLTNGPARGVYREYVGPVAPRGLWLSRAELAGFLLRIVEQGDFVCETVAVAY